MRRATTRAAGASRFEASGRDGPPVRRPGTRQAIERFGLDRRHTLSDAAARPRHSEAVVDQRVLVERARQGDHDAFAALVDPSLARLDAAARLVLRDAELARDAVQESLIRAWRDLPGLRDPDRFDAWLHRLTVHACLDLARRRRRRPIEVELNTIDAPSHADHAGALADRELVDRALRGLDPGHRAVVALHYLLGMPLPDVAAALGIPLGTAKSRLHHALAAMRRTAAPDRDTAPGRVEGGQTA